MMQGKSTGLGFAAAMPGRLLLGLGFCAVAIGGVVAIERGGGAAAQTAAPAVRGGTSDERLAIESTYPVAAWSVTVRGKAVAAAVSTPTSWHGKVALSEDDEVLIIATAATAGPDHRCLRIRFAGRAPRLVWGGGDLTTTVGR